MILIKKFEKLKEELKDYCTFNPTNGDYLVAYHPSTKLFTVSKIDSNAKTKTRIGFDEKQSDLINKETVFCLNENFIWFGIDHNKISLSDLFEKIDKLNKPILRNKKSVINLYKPFDLYKEENQYVDIGNYIVTFFNNFYYVGEITENGPSKLEFSCDWVGLSLIIVYCKILNSKEQNKIYSDENGYCIIDKDKISCNKLLGLVNNLNRQLQK